MTDETNIDPIPPCVTGSPESIWLVYGDIDSDAEHSECCEVMRCEDGQYPADVKYVRADLLDAQAAQIERLSRDCAELRNNLALETVALRAHLDGDKDREIERLKAALYSIDRQLGHDDADDALRDEITDALETK